MSSEVINSRDYILNKIKSSKPNLVKLPDVPMYTYPGDLEEDFIKNVTAFDAVVHKFDTRDQVLEWLKTNFDKSSKCVFSSIPEYCGNVTLTDFKDPHDAHKIDICLSEGVFGVAETGSIWVTNNSLLLAATALFSTDLYLLLDRSTIVDGLHQAYQKVDFSKEQYGSFYTGPSATADIEAVHITGAQGEISLTVLLYN